MNILDYFKGKDPSKDGNEYIGNTDKCKSWKFKLTTNQGYADDYKVKYHKEILDTIFYPENSNHPKLVYLNKYTKRLHAVLQSGDHSDTEFIQNKFMNYYFYKRGLPDNPEYQEYIKNNSLDYITNPKGVEEKFIQENMFKGISNGIHFKDDVVDYCEYNKLDVSKLNIDKNELITYKDMDQLIDSEFVNEFDNIYGSIAKYFQKKYNRANDNIYESQN